MSLAVLSVAMSLDSRPPIQSPAFPRLARGVDGSAASGRPPVETPPVRIRFDEEDAERWDGMA